MTPADEQNDRLQLCVEHIFWDIIDIHDIQKGRKSDLTMITALIIRLVVDMRLRMQDIAKIFDVSRSTVTDYVDYLEKRGYVRRVRGEEDRRDIFIEPTEKGREWIIKKEQATLDYAKASMERLTPEERSAFLGLLSKFVGDIDRPPYDKMLKELEKD